MEQAEDVLIFDAESPRKFPFANPFLFEYLRQDEFGHPSRLAGGVILRQPLNT